MLTSEEQMDIIKSALAQDYRGPIFQLLERATLKKRQEAEQQQQPQQAEKGGLVQSYQATPPSMLNLPRGKKVGKADTIQNAGKYEDGGAKAGALGGKKIIPTKEYQKYVNSGGTMNLSEFINSNSNEKDPFIIAPEIHTAEPDNTKVVMERSAETDMKAKTEYPEWMTTHIWPRLETQEQKDKFYEYWVGVGKPNVSFFDESVGGKIAANTFAKNRPAFYNPVDSTIYISPNYRGRDTAIGNIIIDELPHAKQHTEDGLIGFTGDMLKDIFKQANKHENFKENPKITNLWNIPKYWKNVFDPDIQGQTYHVEGTFEHDAHSGHLADELDDILKGENTDIASKQKGGFSNQFDTNYQESKNYQRIKGSRKGTRKNKDGSEETHLMADNNKDEAWPTLFQDEDGNWFEPVDAYSEAKRRGEIYKFDSREELIAFSRNGNWKNTYQKGGTRDYNPIDFIRGAWSRKKQIWDVAKDLDWKDAGKEFINQTVNPLKWFDGKSATRAAYNELVPINARMFMEDFQDNLLYDNKYSPLTYLPDKAQRFLGKETEWTEKDLSHGELETLKRIVEKRQNKNKIDYSDYGTETVRRSTIKDKLTDENQILKTTLGKAKIEEDDTSYTVTDRFNFNENKTREEQVKNKVIHYGDDPNDAYNYLRWYFAPKYLSEAGEGAQININLPKEKSKKGGFKKKKRFQKAGFDIMQDAETRRKLGIKNEPVKSYNLTQDDAELVGGFVPYLGEVIDLKNTGKALYQGKYGEAALHAAGLMLPFVPGKALVKGYNKLFKKGKPKPKVKTGTPKWSKGVTHYGKEYNPKALDNALTGMKQQGKHLDNINFDASTLSGKNMVFHGTTSSGQNIVEVALPNGRRQLFYRSTGKGRKFDKYGVSSKDKWYPYGGHGANIGSQGQKIDNWFIKDHGWEDYYDSQSYRDIAGNLDKIAAEEGWDMAKEYKFKKRGGLRKYKKGRKRKYHEGGNASQEHIDMMNMGTYEAHMAEHTATDASNTANMYNENTPHVNPDGSPKIDYGFSIGTEGFKPIIGGEGWKKIGKWGKGVWDKSSGWGKAGIVASGIGAPLAAVGSGLIDPSKWFKKGGLRKKRK